MKLSKRVRRRGRSLAPRELERKRRETPRATKLRVEPYSLSRRERGGVRGASRPEGGSSRFDHSRRTRLH
jgi:hypothetical protein